MSPTSYQTAPPRSSIINNGSKAVKLAAVAVAVKVANQTAPGFDDCMAICFGTASTMMN
ncbi:MAG: hypothetical protein WBM24_08120 [Candidatus Sulfotelmatobacter sp.]